MGRIIIGGGIIGLNLAYHLTKRGADEVMLLKRNQLMNSLASCPLPGLGALWRTGCWMAPRQWDLREVDIARVDPATADPAHMVARMDEAVADLFGLQFGVRYPTEERPNCFSGHQNDATTPSFHRPNWAAPVGREVQTVTTAAALTDQSVFTKSDVTGPDTDAFLNSLGTNRLPQNGRIGLICVLTRKGGVLSEFTVTRLGDTHAYLTAAEDIDIAVPATTNLSGFPWLSACGIIIANTPLRALRLSCFGELGWERHLPNAAAPALFLVIETIGKPPGLGYYGAYATNSMRLKNGPDKRTHTRRIRPDRPHPPERARFRRACGAFYAPQRNRPPGQRVAGNRRRRICPILRPHTISGRPHYRHHPDHSRL